MPLASAPDDVTVGGGVWKFQGWTVNGVGVSGRVPMVKGGLEIVGIWKYEANEAADEYGVTYKYDHSVPAEVMATLPKNEYTYSVGQQVPLASAPDDVTVEGGVWKFQGWTVNGVGVSGRVPMAEGGLEIVGTWKYESAVEPAEKVTITFKVVNGTWADGSTTDKTVEIDKGAVLNSDQIPTGMKANSGYKTGAWNADLTGKQDQDATYTYTFKKSSYSGGSGSSSGGSSSTSTKYTLKYNTNGAGSIASESKSKEWTKAYEDLPSPTRKGYKFGGWFFDEKLTKAVKDDVKVDEKTVTLYAKWNPGVADPKDTGVADCLNTQDHIVFLHGYKDGTFAPNRNMSRAEVAQMFYNLLLNKDVPTEIKYTDVKDSDWFAPAVYTLSEMGIITGYQDGTFKPNKAVTRAEFTVIAMRFAKLDNSGENIFTDINSGDWYYDAIVGSIKYGWINGYDDGTFRPNATVTRACVATIVDHMLGRSADEDFVDDADGIVKFSDLDDSYWAYYNIMEATNAHTYCQNDGEETWKALQ